MLPEFYRGDTFIGATIYGARWMVKGDTIRNSFTFCYPEETQRDKNYILNNVLDGGCV